MYYYSFEYLYEHIVHSGLSASQETHINLFIG